MKNELMVSFERAIAVAQRDLVQQLMVYIRAEVIDQILEVTLDGRTRKAKASETEAEAHTTASETEAEAPAEVNQGLISFSFHSAEVDVGWVCPQCDEPNEIVYKRPLSHELFDRFCLGEVCPALFRVDFRKMEVRRI